ncbi:MAG: DUF2889 domain-containing protein [Rhodospirillaceae bacterium]|nr:DUF2889 domain-containing protein [Rhodospirillaceae bacterium]MBT7269165.1 DUF2889 domain-containing protein [Rhodospirillaceae bacterium]
MPLSPPVKRNHIHTREVRCYGYEREDGLWDIEGQITDTKTYSFENLDRGVVAAGTPVHDMLIRLTVDDDLVVQEAEASTESSPFDVCPAISDGVKALKGLKIASGWTQNIQKAIGGIKGCTHINQLITGPLATTAYQSIVPRKHHRKNEVDQGPPNKPNTRPVVIDTCHAFKADGANVQRLWPEYYEGE